MEHLPTGSLTLGLLLSQPTLAAPSTKTSRGALLARTVLLYPPHQTMKAESRDANTFLIAHPHKAPKPSNP